MRILIKECKYRNKKTGGKCADGKEIKKFVNELTLIVLTLETRIDWEKRNELPIK